MLTPILRRVGDAAVDAYVAMRAEPTIQGPLSTFADYLWRATRACLDASEAGARIYLSLGFEDAGPWTQFSRYP